MVLDTVFFDRIVKTMETNHSIVRAHMDALEITEAWMAFGDQLINQCKEILYVAKTNEEHDAIFEQMNEIMNDSFDEDMFRMSLSKAMEKIREFDNDLLTKDDYDEGELD